MKINNVIWLDIGTHFGQEYSSIFSSNSFFFLKIIKRIFNGNILNRQKSINISILKNIIHKRYQIRKQSKYFHSIFIEANPKIIFNKKIYSKADMIFNVALTGEKKLITLKKLYLGQDGNLSQSSSIFSNKKNIKKNNYLITVGVSNDAFFKDLKVNLNNKFSNYELILRLNCEGVEDEIIYSVYKNFGKKLKLICGSLKDVKEIKGKKALNKLNKFMIDRKLPFCQFHSGIESWPNSFDEILKLSNKLK